jgi:murein DD-endopeptidase MepM/ murein hydrolase activator NlpD
VVNYGLARFLTILSFKDTLKSRFMTFLQQFSQKENFEKKDLGGILKRIAVKILLYFLKGLLILKKVLSLVLFLIFKPLIEVGKIIFKIGFLRFYKIYLFFKGWFLKIFLPAKSKLFYPLTRRSIVHFVLILIAIFISTANISAHEIQTDPARVGQKSILYSLVSGGENLGLIEEGSSRRVANYTEEGIVQAPNANGMGGGDETALDREGGLLVKPELVFENAEIRTEIVTYTVEVGDTLSTIAQKFNISVDTILWANKLSLNNLIRPGDKLTILPVAGVVHQVAKGDTLTKIAQEYSADVDKIIEFNKLTDAKDIAQGETLIIPDGKITPPPPAPRSTLAKVREFFIPPSAQVPTGSKMLWPSSSRRITQYFSWRHSGLDIAGPLGIPIYAAESGTIKFVGWGTGYGNHIDIDHGDGMATRYGHLSKILVSKGEKVVKGQTIGLEGSTGWSTGPHLHFEVIINGQRVNPLSYIR